MKNSRVTDQSSVKYAFSKDIDVSLWIDFSEFYGIVPLQEVLGGNFIVVNENLHAEFAEFKGKSYHTLELPIAWLKELRCLKCGADPQKSS